MHIADLSGARLDGADLVEAILSGSKLSGASFDGVVMGDTILANVDLSEVTGLSNIVHHGPSSVGADTIYRSKGKIPEVFLSGAGVPENLTTFMKSLTGSALEFYSCFISYSHEGSGISLTVF